MRSDVKNELGNRYGRLVVVGMAPRETWKTRWVEWSCRCDCGGKTQSAGTNLRRGNSRSCGCIQREVASKSLSQLKWRGDDVGYAGVHSWLKKAKPKTRVCEECGAAGITQNANISGEYRRDIDDFKELCPKCHKKFDWPKMRHKFIRNANGQFITQDGST